MKPIKNYSPDYFLLMIKNQTPFQFSRFGDGEVLCMFPCSWLKKNCDGSRFTNNLKEPMKQIFRNKYNYYHCLLKCTFEPAFGDSITQFKDFLDETCPDMQFYNGDIWQDMSFGGRITELTTAFSPYTPVIIGAYHLRNIKHIPGMKNSVFIEIPRIDAFKKYDYIFNEILKKHSEGHRMFLFSAGYSTKILIDNLYPLIGNDTFLIDMGSVFDPYCGVMSRSGMRKTPKEFFQAYTSYKL